MMIIAFDVGVTGAVAFLEAESCSVEDIPNAADNAGRCIDGGALADILMANVRAGEPMLAAFEDVRPRPQGNANSHGNSMYSQGSLMRSRGTIEGVLGVLRIRHITVQPQAWKDWYGLLRTDKKASLAKARQMFPDVANQLTRVSMDHNRADALLIAHFVLRTKT
jgi:hypothetical protein